MSVQTGQAIVLNMIKNVMLADTMSRRVACRLVFNKTVLAAAANQSSRRAAQEVEAIRHLRYNKSS